MVDLYMGFRLIMGPERQAHSSRNTIIGSTRVARRAGPSIAASAAPTNKAVIHSARKMPSGFFVITSQLESAPTAATSNSVAAAPRRLTEGTGCQGSSSAYLLTAH